MAGICVAPIATGTIPIMRTGTGVFGCWRRSTTWGSSGPEMFGGPLASAEPRRTRRRDLVLPVPAQTGVGPIQNRPAPWVRPWRRPLGLSAPMVFVGVFLGWSGKWSPGRGRPCACPLCAYVFSRASRSVTVVPWPGWLSRCSVPPCRSIRARAMATPNPLPPCARERARSAR